ncbi:MAG: LemA family protein [Bacillota bacterium]
MKRGRVTVKNKRLWLVLGIIAVLVLWVIGGYNGLINADEKVNTAWGQVENNLQRRADLIPNLVSTVKGYAAHEKEVFQAVSDARTKLVGARNVDERGAAEGELSSALSRLLAIAEAYPLLKADANFRQLQDELAGTENRIAFARKDYNDAVRVYRSKTRRFPTVLIANMLGFESRDYFQAEKGAEEVPEVSF